MPPSSRDFVNSVHRGGGGGGAGGRETPLLRGRRRADLGGVALGAAAETARGFGARGGPGPVGGRRALGGGGGPRRVGRRAVGGGVGVALVGHGVADGLVPPSGGDGTVEVGVAGAALVRAGATLAPAALAPALRLGLAAHRREAAGLCELGVVLELDDVRDAAPLVPVALEVLVLRAQRPGVGLLLGRGRRAAPGAAAVVVVRLDGAVRVGRRLVVAARLGAAYDGNKLFKIPSTRLFTNSQIILFQSSRTREARINGSRIMENEFDLSEVEGFEDIPGRPSTSD